MNKRSVLYYGGLVAAVLMIVTLFVGPMTKCLSWNKWNWIISLMLLLGIGTEAACFFLHKRIEPLEMLPNIFYCAGLALFLKDGVQVILDYLRQVNWVQGNYPGCFACLFCMLAACLLVLIRSFRRA